MQVGSATVITSIASTAMNLPIFNRQIKVNAVKREILLATVLQAVAGSAVLLSERWFLR